MGHFPDPHQHASLQEEALKGAPKGSRFRFRASLASEALPEWIGSQVLRSTESARSTQFM